MAVVEIPGSPDRNPIPLGVRVGDLVFGSNLFGVDLETGQTSAGLRPQLEMALHNLQILVERAGGSLANVGRVTMFLDDLGDREAVEAPWAAMFPDPADRPARKSLRTPLPAGLHAQLEAVAVVGARRELLEIPGVPARDPTVKVGNMVFSSRLHGTRAESGGRGADPGEQTMIALQHVHTLAGLAGGQPADIRQVTIFLKEATYRDAIDIPWRQAFPNEASRPLLHVMTADTPPGLLVMAEFIAVL